jgi:CRISPR-associated protein Csd1
VEGLLAGLFDPGLLEVMPDQPQNDLRVFLESVGKGSFPREFDAPNNRFYILGLSPNAARISVRLWHVSTVEEISARIGQHYRNLAIIKNYDEDPDTPSLWQLLRETAAQRDSRNISPVLSGQMMRALLTGTAYPQTILRAIINRIRADRQINYLRAAMLKAYLIRNHKMEVTMSLDTASADPGYLLGRLFAVLERAQEEAIKGASATIKDRFFGAASATPGRVFPVLLRGAQNNIAKLRKSADTRGRAIHFDRLISEIMDGINAFQPTLRLEEQGMFTIGYYHQRKDLFTKKTTTESEEE